MGGTCEMTCGLVEKCCYDMALNRQETYRSREAQRQADDLTVQRLIEASQQRLNSEALAALQRLLAPGQPEGMRVRIFLKYRTFRIGVLRRLFKGDEVTTERTIWQISYAGNKRTAILVSDGRLYDSWRIRRSTDGSPILTNLSWVGSPDTSKQVGLFANPRRVRIERHVDQLVRGLQRLGT